MPQMRQRSPRRSRPPESLYHSLLLTVLYHPKREQEPTTRLYCSNCERIFFEGVVRTRRDRIRFKIAEDVAIEHKFMGHEVVYVRPERLL